MRKIVVFATIVFVFAACFNPWRGDEGDLSIGIGSADGGPLTEINGIPIENFRHIITLSDGPGIDQTIIIDGLGTVNFSVIPGHWTITIKAYVTTEKDGARTINEDEPLAVGSVRVEIKPGPNDAVSIPMGWREWTVRFISYVYGTEIPDETVYHGKKASQPQGLFKNGYTLEGWHTENNPLGHKWDFNENLVTQNITLHANWEQNPPGTFTVTFVSNGGSAVSDQRVTENGKVSQPQGVTRKGHTLEGWYTDYNDFLCKWDFDVNSVTETTWLFANWNENPPSTFTVTFNSNGGTAVPDQPITDGEKASQPPVTRAGHNLEGWYSDNNTFAYRWNFEDYPVNKDLVLYAKWDRGPSYAISFPDIVDDAPIILEQVISRSGSNNVPKTITLTVDNSSQQYGTITWYVTGTNVSGSGSSFTLDSANPAYGSFGKYYVTVEVWKDGIPYSRTVIFEVVE
jgi:hypothetical protein